jgi:hypothetical protein
MGEERRKTNRLFNLRNISILLIFMLSIYTQLGQKNNHRILYDYYHMLLSHRYIAHATLRESFKPFGGEDCLPNDIKFVRQYLRISQVDSFRISPSISNSQDVTDVETRYEIIEEAYPIQVSEESHYLIARSNETLPEGCKVLALNEGIKIVYCP